MKVRKLTFLSLCLAFAIILSYLESYLPSFLPGFRIGTANIFVMLCLYSFGPIEAIFIDLAKVLVVSLLKGNFFDAVFFMSLFGTVFSLVAMILSKYLLKKLTSIGVSVLSSYFHVIGQYVALAIFSHMSEVLLFICISGLISLASGVLIGYLTELILNNSFYQKNVMKLKADLKSTLK